MAKDELRLNCGRCGQMILKGQQGDVLNWLGPCPNCGASGPHTTDVDSILVVDPPTAYNPFTDG